MINNEPIIKNNKDTKLSDVNSLDKTHFNDLDSAIKAIEEQANHYQKAGLTQVSHWLD